MIEQASGELVGRVPGPVHVYTLVIISHHLPLGCGSVPRQLWPIGLAACATPVWVIYHLLHVLADDRRISKNTRAKIPCSFANMSALVFLLQSADRGLALRCLSAPVVVHGTHGPSIERMSSALLLYCRCSVLPSLLCIIHGSSYPAFCFCYASALFLNRLQN